ncbi:sodium/substrate symporter small subunit [Bacteroidota bacterium]
METNNDYNYSIFKPVNEYSRRNRNIIFSIILIWALCVFGFQFLLLILEKPTPEKALLVYESVVEHVMDGEATMNEKQAYAGSLLMVLGKTLKPAERRLLDDALTSTVYSLLNDSSEKAIMMDKLMPLSAKRAELLGLKAAWDEKSIKYVDYKKGSLALNDQIVLLKDDLGLYLNDIADKLIPVEDKFRRVKLIWLPYELRAEAILNPQPIDKAKVDQVMSLYLTHNQSFLTDFRFLGFPFHYFYTAVFLLVLFVLLCVMYAFRIQHLHRKFGMEE